MWGEDSSTWSKSLPEPTNATSNVSVVIGIPKCHLPPSKNRTSVINSSPTGWWKQISVDFLSPTASQGTYWYNMGTRRPGVSVRMAAAHTISHQWTCRMYVWASGLLHSDLSEGQVCSQMGRWPVFSLCWVCYSYFTAPVTGFSQLTFLDNRFI